MRIWNWYGEPLRPVLIILARMFHKSWLYFIIQRVAKANKTFKSPPLDEVKAFHCCVLNWRDHLGQSVIKAWENNMTLPSTLFLLFLSVSIASFHLLPAEQTNRDREFKERVREQRRIGQTRLQDRQPRSVSTLKVLDFSADGDQQPDSNG